MKFGGNVSRTRLRLTCLKLLGIQLTGKNKNKGNKSIGLNNKVVNGIGKGSFSGLTGVEANDEYGRKVMS